MPWSGVPPIVLFIEPLIFEPFIESLFIESLAIGIGLDMGAVVAVGIVCAPAPMLVTMNAAAANIGMIAFLRIIELLQTKYGPNTQTVSLR